MVKYQLPKLKLRVRFPPSAPHRSKVRFAPFFFAEKHAPASLLRLYHKKARWAHLFAVITTHFASCAFGAETLDFTAFFIKFYEHLCHVRASNIKHALFYNIFQKAVLFLNSQAVFHTFKYYVSVLLCTLKCCQNVVRFGLTGIFYTTILKCQLFI